MARQKQEQQPTLVETMEAELAELSAQLAAVETKAADLDPVKDWEAISGLKKKAEALTDAIVTQTGRVQEVRDAEREAARLQAERDHEQQLAEKRAEDERIALELIEATLEYEKLVVAALQRHSTSLLLVGPVRYLWGGIDKAKQAWKHVNPELVGLPKPDPVADEIAQIDARFPQVQDLLTELLANPNVSADERRYMTRYWLDTLNTLARRKAELEGKPFTMLDVEAQLAKLTRYGPRFTYGSQEELDEKRRHKLFAG